MTKQSFNKEAELVIRLQIFADNYAKAKLSQQPSVNMASELQGIINYLKLTGHSLQSPTKGDK